MHTIVDVHVDEVLGRDDHDPGCPRDLLLYRLTLEAGRRLAGNPLSRREIIRKLGTSSARFYRLLYPSNCRRSVHGVLGLLQVLDCDVELVVGPQVNAGAHTLADYR